MPPTSMRVLVFIDRSSDTGNFPVQFVLERFVTPVPSPAPTYAGTVTTAPASPLLTRPGAVAGQGVDAGVADHYGDPLREQRTALAGAALVDRAHRDVVRVAGPDRLSWLHSLTSQHLESLPAGEWTEALVLSPHGHVEHHMTLVDDGSVTLMHVEPGTAPALVAYLDSMRFMLRVEVSDVSASYAVLTRVCGDETPVDELVDRDSLVERVDASGLPLVGLGAHEALRVAAGRPR